MNSLLHRVSQLLLLAGLAAAPSAALVAQSTTDPHAGHDHGTSITCGTFSVTDEDIRTAEINTRLYAPEVYRQAMLDAQKSRTRREKMVASPLGHEFITETNFYVRNARTNSYDQILGGLVYDGELVRIWIDAADTARVKTSQIAQLARALDSTTASGSRDPSKGIVRNNQEVFGLPPTEHLVEGKTDFLLTDIKGNFDHQGAYILGFFSPSDQRAKNQFAYSNEMNLLYLDSKEGLASINSLLNTTAHEHQHLLHYGQNVASRSAQDGDGYTFFNEGASELASLLNGYPSRGIANYLANTNHDLLRYDRDDSDNLLVDYARSMMFITYLYEQFGERFIYDFVKVQSPGVTRVNSAMELAGINLSVDDWRDVIKNYGVANYVQTPPEQYPWYGFRHRPSSGRAAAKKTYTGTDFETSGSIALERFGSAFYVYNNPAPNTYMTFSYTANRPAAVVALFYKGNDVVDVREIPADAPYELGRWGGPYTKIVMSYIALANERAVTTVNWNVSAQVSGVEDETAVAGGLSIAAISPNPARDQAYVRYQTGSGALLMEIFDARGQRVATPVDGATMAAGTHEIGIRTAGFAPGVYMIRLSQGEKITTRPLVVVR